jgi:hypothetical protein
VQPGVIAERLRADFPVADAGLRFNKPNSKCGTMIGSPLYCLPRSTLAESPGKIGDLPV